MKRRKKANKLKEKEKNEKKKKENHECKCQHKDKECCHENDETEEKIKEQQEKIKELENKVLMSQAELINYRKRKDEETSNLLKYANQDLILDLIPVIDNFERAIKLDDNNLSDELSKFLTGFKMMYGQLVEIMKKFGLEEIECLGREFNPNEMEALMVDSDQEKEDNIVLDVLMKGYRLKDRVIRPATVKVNKLENENEKKDKGEDKDE